MKKTESNQLAICNFDDNLGIGKSNAVCVSYSYTSPYLLKLETLRLEMLQLALLGMPTRTGMDKCVSLDFVAGFGDGTKVCDLSSSDESLGARYSLVIELSKLEGGTDCLKNWQLTAPKADGSVYLSQSKDSSRSKNGKLHKKPKRSVADAILDLEVHIEKNHDLYESWFSMAKSKVIDDSGPLAGNRRKRHMS